MIADNRIRLRFMSLCLLIGLLTFRCYAYDPESKEPDAAKPPQPPKNMKLLDRHELLFQSFGEVKFSKRDKVTLSFQLLHDVPAAILHYGIELPGVPVIAMYAQAERCRMLAPETPGKGKRLEAEINLRKRFEEGSWNNRTICYRLEMYVPALQRTFFHDGRFTCHEMKGEVSQLTVLTIVSGPILDCVTSDSAIISFESDRPTLGQVLVTDKDGKSQKFAATATSLRHEISVTGLTPDSRYTYQVLGIGEEATVSSREFAFTTAPERAAEFSFAAMTDCRAAPGGGLHAYEGVNLPVVRELCLDALRQEAKMILFPGDLVSGYTTSSSFFVRQLKAWNYAVEPVAALVPIYEGMGNHEACVTLYDDGSKYGLGFDKQGSENTEALFGQAFVNPQNGPEPEGPGLPPYAENVYFVDYAQVRLVTLNANYWVSSEPEEYGGNLEGYVMRGQLNWLVKVLDEAEKSETLRHVFVLVHEPVFPVDGHTEDAMWYNGGAPEKGHDRSYVVRRRDEIWQTLVAHPKVVAVICGDEHNYSRQLITPETPVYKDGKANPSFNRPLYHIITGGAGAPLYPTGNVPVPWRSAIQKTAMTHHYLLFTVSPAQIVLRCIGRNSIVLDHCVIWKE
jgi:hypothetical protein